MNKDVKEILFSEEEIINRCAELGKELTAYYADKKAPLVVGLLKGSIPFMAELIKHLDVDMRMDFMAVSSYEGTESTGCLKVKKDTDSSVEGENILLVEDIVDTGFTLSKVVALLKEKGAADVKIVTLLDKPERRVAEIAPDFCGFTIPNAFVIGYGLDYNQKYRNLPYVGVIKEEAI